MSGLASVTEVDRFYSNIERRRTQMEKYRLAQPLVRLWDGDFKERGVVGEWRAIEFEFIENDTGQAVLELSLTSPYAGWIMDHLGRDKRNVIITIDKQGARWSGFLDSYKVVKTKEGDRFLSVTFLHDYEQTKHIVCWANPFLRPEFQFPKLWVLFGPAKWCLLMTLFVNLMRLETSLWSLPDNPLDPMEWMPLSFNFTQWRNIVKPFPFLSDNSNITLVFSRFQTFHEMSTRALEDAQLTVTCRRYLPAEDPHPFADLEGELLGNDIVESIFTLFPLRHGVLVWDIVDNSGWGSETSFGGSLITGLIRAVVSIASDGYTEGVDIYTGDPLFPGQYYAPGFLGTNPHAPWVVFEESVYNGIESSEFEYHEATDTSFLTGGQSMPGVNEGISAAINMGGDFLTSVINSQIAAISAVGVGFVAATVSVPPIDIPPLGGLMDAVASPLYSDVVLAFEQVPTVRATSANITVDGKPVGLKGLGDFHYYEGWAEGGEKAFTIGAQAAIRSKMHATRARTAHKVKVADAAPYLIGEKGYGHFWLGDRVATSVLGYPTPNTLFVERVKSIKYAWDQDGPKGWQIEIGYKEPADPGLKALDLIRTVNGALGTIGLL